MTSRLKAGRTDRWGWLRLLCALSLLLVAFAHKPLDVWGAGQAYAGVDVARFILPDGSLPDLCLTGENQDGHHADTTHCEACRIVSSVDLPYPFDGFEITRRDGGAGQPFPQDAGPARTRLRPDASPRGPPTRILL